MHIITRTEPRWQTEDWQIAVQSGFKDIGSLLEFVGLAPEDIQFPINAARQFPLKVPRHYAELIEKNNPYDPLLRQVLPVAEEDESTQGFSKDPLQEAGFTREKGLIHKYHGRVLLIANPSCAIHCRYCFRRHFPYEANTPSSKEWQESLNYIQNNPDIHEVILSGGDPLSSADRVLQKLVNAIEQIEHIKTLRIHTRYPSLIPQRITPTLMQILSESRLKVLMVLHINHANEISTSVEESLKYLQSGGIRLLNQSVLLKGVNNSLNAMTALLKKLHELDIQAYYLHLLDKVEGTAHFYCPDDEALSLYQHLQASLPGYMLPKLVRETPDKPSKTPIS